MQCAKHREETAVSCGRCETPVCAKCMVHTDVGVRCRQCAPPQRGGPARSKSVLGVVAVVFLVILAIGYLGSRGGSDANQGYGDYYDDDEGYSASVLAEFAKGVTVSRVTDPWTPDDGAVSAAAGRRFAALEITVEGSNVMGAVYVSPMSFKLTDSEGFAYGALQDGGAEPRLAMIDLRSGEKTRGWLTFEVDESSEIRSLSYFGIDLELP